MVQSGDKGYQEVLSKGRPAIASDGGAPWLWPGTARTRGTGRRRREAGARAPWAHAKEGPATTRVTGPSRHANAPRWSATSCSPTDYSAVPSALGGLTSGFGMGPGVPPPPWSLTNEGHSAVRGRPGRALRAAQRATGSRDRARRRVTHRHLGSRVMEELGLLVTLG